jgi:hypothetical protein
MRSSPCAARSAITLFAVLTLGCSGSRSDKLGHLSAADAEVGDDAAEAVDPADERDGDVDAADLAPEDAGTEDGSADGIEAGASADAEADAQVSDIAIEDLEGHWSNPTWGNMVLRHVGTELRGSYSYDQGTVLGSYENGLFVGWWTEVPSRLPMMDAGEVEFRFARNADGSIYFDGHWRYGTTGAWNENWDLTFDPSPAAAELEARFDDPTAFAAHP